MELEPFSLVRAFRIEGFSDTDARYRATKEIEGGYLDSAENPREARDGLRRLYREHLGFLMGVSDAITVLTGNGALDLGDFGSTLQMAYRRIELLERLIEDLNGEGSK